ncbi:tRNA (adenosine(37)-N6)-threonylcarbamoyltransferase complex dimerization subunit type 1 TsaB [candidate division KSB3 bacterium]|uniref:tRNA (Adenosine(37)-N6)-threonylcarbamoyltransferase complex dimerization subunit type 1 TsaB n=1 Tax=candidate division KSB3 bacterium TaxID=2044937 RepID=A0A2G6EAR2_9BACT|nr:MAG: tRNA (adenosine(37)-N6)-threonylcarbamoyltransferase complex dimerization subunit type 1 TsaB [candidate division KSB3 bacterium]PIE30994.1 MAG: tRNA (adenosine(37)-N6)-threonylcarbamoyltransferase complex dimerization subunit type 1 TsaB [candidate division KSB3 bacterium]
MHILGIDTSTMTGSIAVISNDRLLAEYSVNTKTTHAERLIPSIDVVLRAASLTVWDLDGIAVSSGPGSFTGLRIGMTTARSLAYSIQKPLVGVSSLDALAAQYLYCSLLVCPVLDARKKEVYSALYRNTGSRVQRLSGYRAIAPELLVKDIQEPVLFLGDGVVPYGDRLQSLLGEMALFADPAHLLPRASLVAALGRERLVAGDIDDYFSLTPTYIRKSDAEIHWDNAHSPRKQPRPASSSME